MSDRSNIAGTPPSPGAIITPSGASEPRELLEERDRQQFRLLVIAEAKLAARREADLARHRSLKSDRRALLAQLARNEEETREIEARLPRRLRKT